MDDDNISADDIDSSSYNDQPSSMYSHHTISRLNQEEPDSPRTMSLTSNSYSSRYHEYENENEPSEPM